MPAALVVAAMLAQSPGPRALALSGYRLHLRVSESVAPERLRALAASGTVLWLRTRSNMLRDSTMDAVARFPEAYIELRPPLRDAQVQQFRHAPRAGVWLDAAVATGDWYRLGPRPVAVDIRGGLEAEQATRIAALRPKRVTWMPRTRDEATLAAWGELVWLPGVKVVDLSQVAPKGPPEAALVAPEAARTAASPVPAEWWAGLRGAWAKVAWLEGQGAARPPPSWGLGRRVRVQGLPDDEALVALFSQTPGVELELDVSDDAQSLETARAWVERLEAAVRGGAR
ncbi:hypothetical protein DRW03_22225 [Corallococcus sp. H22C18031201]|nr:hypothetical protein DRW03_22225 [Corallococcus sp. H22C18031201]